MLFDIDSNVIVFFREPFPTNDHEKFKLSVVACYKIGEPVSKAIIG